MWAGLGYYRRARFLLQGAKAVACQFDGVFPTTSAELQKIPGACFDNAHLFCFVFICVRVCACVRVRMRVCAACHRTQAPNHQNLNP